MFDVTTWITGHYSQLVYWGTLAAGVGIMGVCAVRDLRDYTERKDDKDGE